MLTLGATSSISRPMAYMPTPCVKRLDHGDEFQAVGHVRATRREEAIDELEWFLVLLQNPTSQTGLHQLENRRLAN